MAINLDRACGTLNKTALHVAEHLWSPLVKSLADAAEELSYARETSFVLMPMNPVRVLIALSGGRDSMTLLDLMARFFYREHQCLVSRLRAVYVHHGLSDNADAWEVHCERETRKRGVPFEAIHVNVDRSQGGVEAAARLARYRALEASAIEHGDDIVLTAHHEDDRLETFLLQLLRGAGPDGLAAFPETRQLRLPGSPGVDGAKPLLLLRPWRNIPRSTINEYAKSAKLTWVEDESNDDKTYARNRIRHDVMPLLGKIDTRFRAKAGRSMGLTQELVEGIHSVAEEDLARVTVENRPHTISVSGFLKLSPVRQKWCLRVLCQKAGAQLPSEAKLEDTLRQIMETNNDTSLCVSLDGHELRRWGDWLLIRKEGEWMSPAPQSLYITNPSVIPLPEWKGELQVTIAAPDEWGIPLSLIQSSAMKVQARQGGEKFKRSSKRPTKSLKDWFAEADIPSFERDQYPLFWLGDALLLVGGIGMNAMHTELATEGGETLVKLNFARQNN